MGRVFRDDFSQRPGSAGRHQARRSGHVARELRGDTAARDSDAAGHVVPQSAPHALVVDPVVGVVHDDPHAFDLPPGLLARPGSQLLWELRCDAAEPSHSQGRNVLGTKRADASCKSDGAHTAGPYCGDEVTWP
jgi:hypothetical protein